MELCEHHEHGDSCILIFGKGICIPEQDFPVMGLCKDQPFDIAMETRLRMSFLLTYRLTVNLFTLFVESSFRPACYMVS